MKICHFSRTLFFWFKFDHVINLLVNRSNRWRATDHKSNRRVHYEGFKDTQLHSRHGTVACAATAIPSSYQLSSQVNSAQGHLRPKCRATALDLNCCNWKDFIAFGISNKITQLEIMTIHFMLHLMNMRAEICRSVCVVVSKLSPGLF